MQEKREPAFYTLMLMISFAVVNAVLITPALPAISSFFSVSSDTAQLIMTWYLIGYALGQLVYGPLANRFGRKKALYMGVSLQIVSSFACVLAGMLDNFSLLVFARFTLALGAGVGLKMAFTIVNECYEPKVVSQKVSYLMLAFAVTPGLSMALGGFLNDHFGWMSCFYAGAAYGLLLFPLLTQLPETQKILDLDALVLKHLLNAYATALKNIQLIAGGLLMGLTTCFIYVFATFAPFVAIDLLGMTSEAYGFANMLPSLGYVLGAITSAHMAKKYSLGNNIKTGIFFVMVGIVLMTAGAFMNLSSMLALFIPITIIYFGEALIYPNASAIAMGSATDKAHASAVMNFLTIALPTLAVLSFGLFSITQMLLPIIFTVLCVAIIIIYSFAMRVRRKTEAV